MEQEQQSMQHDSANFVKFKDQHQPKKTLLFTRTTFISPMGISTLPGLFCNLKKIYGNHICLNFLELWFIN